MKHKITESQWSIFSCLLQAKQALNIQEIQHETGVDQAQVASAVRFGEEQGWLRVFEQQRLEMVAAPGLAEMLTRGLPERQVLNYLRERSSATLAELVKIDPDNPLPVNEVIKWGNQRNWLEKQGNQVVMTETGRQQLDRPAQDEEALRMLLDNQINYLDQLAQKGLDPEEIKKLLERRANLVKIKPRVLRWVEVTEKGAAALKDEVILIRERNVLSSEEISSGDWRNLVLRRYDVGLATERVFPAKIHLMQKIIAETRKAFLEMGFTEVVSPMVETAFWTFDALFQPQDHPARDMQDTFYLERPASAGLPHQDLVRKVQATHENGGDTGSSGWGYQWVEAKARQIVLRTHTTATSIRALAANPHPPRKVFSVGKVFRNESISYKHLPEFFQVDGIVIDQEANFSTLLGTLQEFYLKMGFSKVRFKPSFYPYTEPSADINVYMESKGKWIELGGAGLFRPEVTRPFGCSVPVLAWGLGLDRLAMMRYGIDDIRELFWSDLEKITEVPLCR